MLLEIGGQTYAFQWTSDVSTRDGLGLEVFDGSATTRRQLCEIFRDDTADNMTFTAFERDIPFEVVERACAMARDKLMTAHSAREI